MKTASGNRRPEQLDTGASVHLALQHTIRRLKRSMMKTTLVLVAITTDSNDD